MRSGVSQSFATTHWTRVLAAGHGEGASAREAMEGLCRVYWYPLYAYVRKRGYSAADAEDLTQGFFERLLRLDSLAGVEQGRGRFRSFLLAAMNHYIADAWDKASAGRRDVRKTIPLDTAAAETRYGQQAIDRDSPERAYQRQWAIALLEQVVQRLREEYEADGKGEVFMVLRFAIAGERGAAYADVAKQLKMSEPAVRVAVHRLRRRYRELLREEIAQTVESETEVDEELRELFAAVG